MTVPPFPPHFQFLSSIQKSEQELTLGPENDGGINGGVRGGGGGIGRWIKTNLAEESLLWKLQRAIIVTSIIVVLYHYDGRCQNQRPPSRRKDTQTTEKKADIHKMRHNIFPFSRHLFCSFCFALKGNLPRFPRSLSYWLER